MLSIFTNVRAAAALSAAASARRRRAHKPRRGFFWRAERAKSARRRRAHKAPSGRAGRALRALTAAAWAPNGARGGVAGLTGSAQRALLWGILGVYRGYIWGKIPHFTPLFGGSSGGKMPPCDDKRGVKEGGIYPINIPPIYPQLPPVF